MFSDKKLFECGATTVNSQNERIWSKHQKKRLALALDKSAMKEMVQKSLGVMVCAIMTLDRVFPPVFVEPNVKLDSDGHVTMIVNQNLPAILAHSADLKNNYIWQQDNAPSHVSRKSMIILTSIMDGHAIMEYPPNSPDLSPLDYWLWDAWQRKIDDLNLPTNTPTQLRAAIITAHISFSTPEGRAEHRRAVESWSGRLMMCRASGGHRFEDKRQSRKRPLPVTEPVVVAPASPEATSPTLSCAAPASPDSPVSFDFF